MRKKRLDESKITISICCLTYNHECYIERAIKGFLNQQTLFPYEIVIHDDASSDGTTRIIKRYQKQFPKLIKPVFQQENLFSQGKSLYELYTKYVFPSLKGSYIAVCEGDDYWTDPLKLQKQVAFLEQNHDFSMCFHNIGILKNGTTDNEAHNHNTGYMLPGATEFTLLDLIRGNFIPNCSVVYRKMFYSYPDIFNDSIFPDWPLHILHASKGRIRYLDEIMAVHHFHPKGIWNGLGPAEQRKAECGMLRKLFSLLDRQYHYAIRDTLEIREAEFNRLTRINSL